MELIRIVICAIKYHHKNHNSIIEILDLEIYVYYDIIYSLKFLL